MKWLALVVRRIDQSNNVIVKVVSLLVLVSMTTTLYDVIMRYFFHAPTIWAYELGGLLLGPFWLLGGGYVLLQDAHVRMDVLHRRLSYRSQAIVDLVTYTFFLFYCSLILIYGIDHTWTSFIRQDHSRTLWKPLLWPWRAIVPLGAALILVAGIAKYARDFHMAITGRRLE